jgi:hypothetical protein
VIAALVDDQIGVSHEATARPSTSTKHAPHWPVPQPNRAPTSPNSLRSAYSNGVSGPVSTCRSRPLTVSTGTASHPEVEQLRPRGARATFPADRHYRLSKDARTKEAG